MELAQIAYEAYYKSLKVDWARPWEQLEPKYQDAWRKVVQEVETEVLQWNS